MKSLATSKICFIGSLILFGGLSLACPVAQATPALEQFSAGNGWIQFADDDGVGYHGYVNPGWGGQDFDAEYLFYKKEGNTLSIALQSGFNVDSGDVLHGSKHYYAGDLALSFDGDASNYEYAFDFGKYAEGYWVNDKMAAVAAGLYKVDTWSNDVYFTASNPFAMLSGTRVTGASELTVAGYNSSLDTYWRTMSFDLSSLPLTAYNGFSAHWTMSCGNDAITGTAPVPEPATMFLFGSGLVGLAGWRKRRVGKA